MEISDWDQRYRAEAQQAERVESSPSPLVVQAAGWLPAGRALDVACGSGHNAIWLAERGWTVTAVDGAEGAIEIVRRRAAAKGLNITTRVADLEAGEFAIPEGAWDLIVIAYYLQRGLFEKARAGVRPGGLLLAIVHTAAPGEEPTAHRPRPGELRGFFPGWEVLHAYEGQPQDPEHRRGVAEILARKPSRGRQPVAGEDGPAAL